MVEDWDDDDDNGGGGGGGHDAGSNPVVWDPLKYDSFSLLHNFFFFEVLFLILVFPFALFPFTFTADPLQLLQIFATTYFLV